MNLLRGLSREQRKRLAEVLAAAKANVREPRRGKRTGYWRPATAGSQMGGER